MGVSLIFSVAMVDWGHFLFAGSVGKISSVFLFQ